jgi:hypothetical protein
MSPGPLLRVGDFQGADIKIEVELKSNVKRETKGKIKAKGPRVGSDPFSRGCPRYLALLVRRVTALAVHMWAVRAHLGPPGSLVGGPAHTQTPQPRPATRRTATTTTRGEAP